MFFIFYLKVSPMLGLTAGFLILIFVPEPKRGIADQLAGRLHARTSWLCDMKALAKKYATCLFFFFLSITQEWNGLNVQDWGVPYAINHWARILGSSMSLCTVLPSFEHGDSLLE